MLGALVYNTKRKIKVNRKIFSEGGNGINHLTLQIDFCILSIRIRTKTNENYY